METVRNFNSIILAAGKKLRSQLLFDIAEDIDYPSFFKSKFLKEQTVKDYIERVVLKSNI